VSQYTRGVLTAVLQKLESLKDPKACLRCSENSNHSAHR
jgi:hypothetical protein